MDLTLQWYFSVGILAFCAVTLAMRIGTLAQRLRMESRTRTTRPAAPSGKLVRWLAARFNRRSDNWYCFFRISDLTGENQPNAPRPREQTRTASRSRMRMAAPPRR